MKKYKLWHILFLIGIFFKGLDGVLETCGGLVLLFLKHATILKYTRYFFKNELAQYQQNIVVQYLINLVAHTSRDTEVFAAVYLLVHGVIKISIAMGLYLRKLWVYPLAEIVLSLLAIYQIYRFFHTYSILLIILTGLDIFMIFLIWTEHKRLTALDAVKSS